MNHDDNKHTIATIYGFVCVLLGYKLGYFVYIYIYIYELKMNVIIDIITL